MPRMGWPGSLAPAFGLFAMALAGAVPAAAQELAGCSAEALTDPPRILYRCGGGLLIEAEEGADVAPLGATAGERTDAVAVDGKAVFVAVAPGRGSFQIMTPHAIASVRGTVYAVDVSADTTSVFVSEGSVAVSRADGSGAVDLGPGQGVDVTADAPLTVRNWPQPRVQRLLARFGR